jgi:hypothetical protein
MHKKTFDILEMGGDAYNAPDQHFHVDDMIALPIQVLNRKGYTTKACCSGHPFGGYLAFHKNIILPTLPPGFIAREDNLGSYSKECILDSTYKVPSLNNMRDAGTTISQWFQDIRDNMEQMHQWALNLPDCPTRARGVNSSYG